MYISEIIETQRRIKGMSQEELSIKAHMSLSTYHKRLENPDSFRVGELKLISKAIGLPIEVILTAKIRYAN